MAVSCAPFIQDGSARTVYVSVALDYEDPGRAAPLPQTINDAEAFAKEIELLSEASGTVFEAHEFTDENGSLVGRRSGIIYDREGLLAYISDLETSAGDLIIFYFSGHGIAADGSSYIAIGPECGEADLLSVRQLRETLAELPGHACIILDSCQSGSETEAETAGEVFSEEGELLGSDILRAISAAFPISFTASADDDAYILSACTATQNSSAGATIPGFINAEKHSLFTYCLLHSLGYDFADGRPRFPADSTITFYSLYEGVLESMPGEFWMRQTAQPARKPIDLVLFSWS